MWERLYVEALLTNESAADDGWAIWAAGLISDDLAACAWALIAFGGAGAQRR
jgi:hypothetical protein